METPQYIINALTSSTFYDGIMKIGEHNNLHLDQIDELTSEIKLLFLNRTSPDKFLPNIIDRLEIDEPLAKKIIEEVNTSVILPLRKELQEGSEPVVSHHMETPDEILKHIEDGGLELPAPEKPAAPEPEPEQIPEPEHTPTPVETPLPEPEIVTPPSENLTEHLLQNTVASPHIEEKKVEKKYSVDPYREPLM